MSACCTIYTADIIENKMDLEYNSKKKNLVKYKISYIIFLKHVNDPSY